MTTAKEKMADYVIDNIDGASAYGNGSSSGYKAGSGYGDSAGSGSGFGSGGGGQ